MEKNKKEALWLLFLCYNNKEFSRRE